MVNIFQKEMTHRAQWILRKINIFFGNVTNFISTYCIDYTVWQSDVEYIGKDRLYFNVQLFCGFNWFK